MAWDWLLALAGVAGPAIGLWIAEGLFTAEEAPEESTGFFKLPSVAWVMTAVLGLEAGERRPQPIEGRGERRDAGVRRA